MESFRYLSPQQCMEHASGIISEASLVEAFVSSDLRWD